MIKNTWTKILITDNVSIYTAALGQKRADDDLQHVAIGTNLSVFNRLLLNLDYEQNNQNEKELEFTARSQVAEQSLLFSVMLKQPQLFSEMLKQILLFSMMLKKSLLFSVEII